MNWRPKHGIGVSGKSLNRLFFHLVPPCQAHCLSKILFSVFWIALLKNLSPVVFPEKNLGLTFPRLAIRCSTSQSLKGAITVSKKSFFFKNLVFLKEDVYEVVFGKANHSNRPPQRKNLQIFFSSSRINKETQYVLLVLCSFLGNY